MDLFAKIDQAIDMVVEGESPLRPSGRPLAAHQALMGKIQEFRNAQMKADERIKAAQAIYQQAVGDAESLKKDADKGLAGALEQIANACLEYEHFMIKFKDVLAKATKIDRDVSKLPQYKAVSEELRDRMRAFTSEADAIYDELVRKHRSVSSSLSVDVEYGKDRVRGGPWKTKISDTNESLLGNIAAKIAGWWRAARSRLWDILDDMYSLVEAL